MPLKNHNLPELSDYDYQRFRKLILDRSGLYFPEHKRIDLSLGLSQALIDSSLISSKRDYDLNQYYNLLSDPTNPLGRSEMERLINILTIGETYFFRDEAQFNALTNYVLPEIIKRKRAAAMAFGSSNPPRLRIWSAGCASGEEPYSVAILLKEMLSDFNQWQILILGTDINQMFLQRARKAQYSNWSFREHQAKARQNRYFTYDPASKTYQLNDEIRQIVTFNSLNLTENIYPSVYTNTADMDLIICRNVTIYFQQQTTEQVVRRFYEALIMDGWLMVGHAESSLSTYRAFQARSFPHAVLYQKTGEPTVWPDSWRSAKIDDEVAPTPILPKPTPKLNPNPSFSPPKIPPPKSSKPQPPEKPSVSPPDSDLYEAAQILLDDGYNDRAIEKLNLKLELEPDYAPAYSLLGRAYANMGHFVEATIACKQAIQLDPLLTEAYLTLALIYQHDNQLDLAISSLKKATYLDHRAPLPYFNLAVLYKNTGQSSQAKRTLQIAIKILEKWPANKIVPETGGETTQHLLQICQQMLKQII